MRALRTFLLVAALLATSQAFFLKNSDEPSTGQKFISDVKTVANDLQQSVELKKKAIVGAVNAIVQAKLGILKDIKDTKVYIISNIIGTKLAKLAAIKAAKLAFLRAFLGYDTSVNQNLENAELSSYLETHPLVAPHLPNLELFDVSGIHPFDVLAEQLQNEESHRVTIGDKEYVFIPLSKIQGIEQDPAPPIIQTIHQKIRTTTPAPTTAPTTTTTTASSSAATTLPTMTISTSRPLPTLPPAPTLPPLTLETFGRKN